MARLAPWARAFAPFLAVALIPVAAFVASGWRATVTVWPVPIDDAYIYAQYARSFAHGRPFEWSPGDGYSRGCTSPLYPVLLAPIWLLGLRDHWLMMGAALLNTLGLAVGLMAVHRLVRDLGGAAAAGIAVAVLATTGVVAWNAASGMEAGLAFGASGAAAFAFARAARDGAGTSDFIRLAASLAVLALLRPESLVAGAMLCAFVLPGGGSVPLGRRMAILGCVPVPLALYFGLNGVVTGDMPTASMLTKSMWHDPTIPAPIAVFTEQVLAWPSHFWPGIELAVIGRSASELLVPLLVVAVLLLGGRPGGKAMPMYLLLFAAWLQSLFLLGQRVPTGGPHMRYVMPYLPLVVAPIAVLASLACDGASAALLRRVPGIPRRAVWLVWGSPALALLLAVPWQLDRFREHREAFAAQSRVLQQQQIAIGRFIADANRARPGTFRRLFTHDAGALIYFSGIRGFDAHGLCMELPGYPIHSAQYEGTFFPFEALEHSVPDEDVPDVSALFSAGWGQWPNADERILTPDVPVEARAFLVGTDMKLFRFPREAVRSGHSLNPDERGDWVIHDRLDVADLISERDHKFHMDWPAGRPYRGECVLVDRTRTPPLADVGRQIRSRTHFWMRMPAGPSRIVARLQGLRPGSTAYSVDGVQGGEIESQGNEGPVLVHLADCVSENPRGALIRFEPKGSGMIGLAHVYVLRPPDTQADPTTEGEHGDP